MTVVLHRADVAAINSQFEVVADDAADRVQQRIVQQVSFLKAAHSFFISQGSVVDRKAFASFVAGLDLPKRYEGIGGIGYSEYIVTGDEALVEAEIDTEYGEPAFVWPETTDQGRRAPIVIIEPIDFLREGALGFDSFSDPVRREAIIGAIATGRAHASGVVSLVQSAGGKERGVIVYFPVREEVEGTELGPIKGFVFGGFYVDSLHEATLRRDPKLPVVVRTEDITNGGAAPVYESPNFEEIAETSPFDVDAPHCHCRARLGNDHSRHAGIRQYAPQHRHLRTRRGGPFCWHWHLQHRRTRSCGRSKRHAGCMRAPKRACRTRT